MTESENRQHLPVLTLKNGVLFPHQMLPLVVGVPRSVAAVEAAMSNEDKTLVVVSQHDDEVAEPQFDDLFSVGTKAVIKKMARVDNAIQIIVQGLERVTLARDDSVTEFLQVEATPIPRPDDWDTQSEALHREILDLAKRVLERVNPEANVALQQMIDKIESPLHQVYLLSALLSLDLENEQKLLAAPTQSDALQLTHDFLTHEVKVLEVRQQIAEQAQTEMSREQREYLLRKQLRAIQEQLGERNPEQADADELRHEIGELDLPAEVKREAERELDRLERLPSASPDYQVTRSYLELVAELPWTKTTSDKIDLQRAREILDRDHFGLDDVKERIIEFLAVLKLNPDAKSPVLCFVGPPGVGKTSLGKSIAEAIGRQFSRESLGGLSDEAELRGHRRTYIGAMPGRIIQAIRRTGVKNPLLMLDEIDKLGRDMRGDPAAALLEILDPAQNHQFRDNYLNLPFDLSQVFFIGTANTLDTIPQPLLDRIEVLSISGYSDEEKLQIARRYLLPRQIQQTGLSDRDVTMSDDALRIIIRSYTRESGVRELERVISRVCRKVATLYASGRSAALNVDQEQVIEMLGAERYEHQRARETVGAGVAAGLAWTPVGGNVLYVEAVLLPDSRELMLTGQLGDVMKESARTAQSFVRSQWAELNLEKQALECGIHIHVPAGATPKDGPSAGVTMAVALASIYSHQPVRSDTAMTGEITLSGLVLPVGGIKEKVLAAHRAGISCVILPKANERDVEQLPHQVREEIEFVFAESAEQAVTAAIPSLANRFTHA